MCELIKTRREISRWVVGYWLAYNGVLILAIYTLSSICLQFNIIWITFLKMTKLWFFFHRQKEYSCYSPCCHIVSILPIHGKGVRDAQRTKENDLSCHFTLKPLYVSHKAIFSRNPTELSSPSQLGNDTNELTWKYWG